MKLHPQFKMDLNKVVVITCAYLLISWFFAFYNQAAITSIYSLGPTPQNDIKISFVASTVAGLLAGILGGTVMVVVNNRVFRRKSYGYALMATTLAFTVVFVFITIAMSVLMAWLELGDKVTFSAMTSHASSSIFSVWTVIYFVQWAVIMLLTLFFLQVSDKFGPGILSKFLRGKYYQPKEEARIFMFLDMKSSTSHAEQLGHEKYFNLLSDVFSDITGSILNNAGEIYQYVGDEIVVSWSLQKGLSNANCLNCFHAIQKKLDELALTYMKKYGVTPEFKAGLHHGMVTAGEVGSIKRDIVFSGDVLNTTSRIQEQCNNYQVKCLISKQTLDLIKDQNTFEPIPLGNIKLKGKEEIIELNTIKVID